VLFSRALMIPVYLSKLGVTAAMSDMTVTILKSTSFAIMAFALLTGAVIILRAMFQGRRAERALAEEAAALEQS
jgi:hypothetical protein